jgi:transcriptional regulator with XRE-family HTH domain
MKAKGNLLVRFGAKVCALRRVAGLSQDAFADLFGLDRTYIGRIERGKRNVSLRNIALIAKAGLWITLEYAFLEHFLEVLFALCIHRRSVWVGATGAIGDLG